MKKNTFWMLLSILVGGLVLFVNFKINVGINKLSDVSLENVEAKASGEGGGATLYPQHITFLSDEKCTFTMVHGGGDGTVDGVCGWLCSRYGAYLCFRVFFVKYNIMC